MIIESRWIPARRRHSGCQTEPRQSLGYGAFSLRSRGYFGEVGSATFAGMTSIVMDTEGRHTRGGGYPEMVKHLDSPRTVARVYLSLGSNSGDRESYLRESVARLSGLPETRLVAVSSVIETKPVDVDSDQPDFLNEVVAIETRFTPRQLLEETQRIERELGRIHKGLPHQARTIDIDILLFDDLAVDEPDLQIPHPRMRERAFVMGLLEELQA